MRVCMHASVRACECACTYIGTRCVITKRTLIVILPQHVFLTVIILEFCRDCEQNTIHATITCFPTHSERLLETVAISNDDVDTISFITLTADVIRDVVETVLRTIRHVVVGIYLRDYVLMA